jgi:WD40 repeat protein
MVTGGWSDRFRLIDVASGAESNPFAIPPDRPTIKAAYTPDGQKLLALGSDQISMTLWDLARGKESHHFVGHRSPVDTFAFSPDGKLLASSGTARAWMRGPPPGALEDVFIRIWDVTTGKELRQFSGRASTLAFSPDGSLLAAGSNDWNSPIRLLDPQTGAEVRRLQFAGHGPFRFVFSRDGKAIASVGRDGSVRLWEVATGGERRNFAGHFGEVHGVAFSLDGRCLVTRGADTTALVWDVRAAETRFPDLAAAVQAMDAPDAGSAYRAICALIAASDRAVPHIATAVPAAEPENPERLSRLLADLDAERFNVREQATTDLAKLADAAEPALRQLLAGKPTPEARRRAETLLEGIKLQVSQAILRGLRAIEVLDLINTPVARKELEHLAGGAPGVRLTREARAALDRLSPRSARRWSPPSFNPPAGVETLLGGPVRGGKIIDGTPLPPWAIDRYRPINAPQSTGPYYRVSRDARLAVELDHYAPKIRLLELPSGRERHAIKPPNSFNWVSSIALSPDGTRLAGDTSHGPDSFPHLYMWDWASARELWKVDTKKHEPTAIVFSPAGDLLATVGFDHFVRLWDAKTGQELRSWSVDKDYNIDIAFSPDGKLLIAGGSKIRIWNTATAELVRQLDDRGSTFAFSPDGKFLFSNRPGGLSIWEIATGRLQRVLVNMGSARSFTPDGRSVLAGPRLVELATGKVRVHLAGHAADSWMGAGPISSDGRTVSSLGGDGLYFVWDLTGLAPAGRFAAVALSAAEQEGLWRLLAGDDAAVAYRAGWRLTAGDDASVAFLRDRLAPVTRDIGRLIDRLVADLAAADEAARQAATEQLESLGELAAPALRAALSNSNGEARDRLEYLLPEAERPVPTGERIRGIRAIEILERIGTPAARAALATLADGHPEAALTREAASSSRRLERRSDRR